MAHPRMTRLHTWILCAALLGALLWLLQRHDSATLPPVTDGPPDGRALDATADAELASVDASAQRGRMDIGPRATAWLVEVVAADGSTLRDVRLRARCGDEALDAEGRASWAEPSAGTWTLDVEAEAFPRWSREVVVVADTTTRTRVVMGEPHRLAGRVLDSYGDPRKHHLVGFVRAGAAAPTSPREWLELPHARTDVAGRFLAELPRGGRWRVFVGYSGKVLFEDTGVVELTEKGPFEVELVVPAPTRLLIEAHEPPGLGTDVPIGVSVYRLAEVLDRERPLPPQITTDELPDLEDPALDEDTRAELTAAVAAQSQPLDDAERAALAYRLSVVPPGWRMDRSSILDAERRLLLEFLPVGEELRFAVSRGAEVFRVEGSAWLVDSPPTRVRLDLPAPLPPDVTPGVGAAGAMRTVRATVEPVKLRRAPLAVGATWR
jgi:hypothetical protein